MNTVVAPVSLLNTSRLRRRLSLGVAGVRMSTWARTSARSGPPCRLKSTETILPNGSSRGLSERKAVGVDKAPVNEHTIWYANVDQVEPGTLIHGYADRSEAHADIRKDVGLRSGCTKSQ
jgi:hypothetical protein